MYKGAARDWNQSSPNYSEEKRKKRNENFLGPGKDRAYHASMGRTVEVILATGVEAYANG